MTTGPVPPSVTLHDILRPGIAGYIPPGHRFISEAELADFRRGAYAAAHDVAGRLVSLRPMGAAHGFYAATIEARGRPAEHILRHSVLPYIAAASAMTDEGSEIEFASSSHLAPFFPRSLLILPRELLEAPLVLDAHARSLLDKFSLSAIDLWEPKRVGDLVFNWWD